MKIKIEQIGTVYQTDLQVGPLSVTVLAPTIQQSLIAAHAKWLNQYFKNFRESTQTFKNSI